MHSEIGFTAHASIINAIVSWSVSTAHLCGNGHFTGSITLNSIGRTPGLDLLDLPQRVLDSLATEIAILDKAGTIVAVNDAWTRFGQNNGGRDSATGVGANYLDACRSAHGDEGRMAEQAYRGIREVIQKHRETFSLEYPCHAGSTKRWFMLHVCRVKSTDNLFLTAHFSITDRKFAEEKLVQSERLAAIGEAMRGLSHEGRNALQLAQANIDLLGLQLEDNTDAMQMLVNIETAHNRILKLYEQVNRYAKPIALNRNPTSLSELMDKAWRQLAPAFPAARFRQLGGIEEPVCDVDPLLIEDVFQSILENAVTAGAAEPEIHVQYLYEELDGCPAVTVVVHDNGTGIAADDSERAFRPFFTTKLRGAGLGLAISQRMIAAHGGRIRFTQPEDHGSSIRITLPKCRGRGPDSTALRSTTG